MDTPVYAAKQYVGSALLSSNDATLSGGVAAILASLCSIGFINFESISVAATGLVAETVFGSDFLAIFSGNVVAGAHGTADNADTQTYSTSFASLVPATGSLTAYLYATPIQIGMDPVTNVGPAIGHPNYDPTYVPTQSYTFNRDSFSLTAGASVPVGSLEVARTTLTAGQTTGLVFDFTHAIPAGAYSSSISSKVQWIEAATYSVGAVQAGTNFDILNAGTAVILPAPASLPSTFPQASFTVLNTSNGEATLSISGGAVFVGFAVSGLTSVTMQPKDYVTVVSEGVNYRVIAASPNLNGALSAIFAALNGNSEETFSAYAFITQNGIGSSGAFLPLQSNVYTASVNLANSAYVQHYCANAINVNAAVTLGQAQETFAAINGTANGSFYANDGSAAAEGDIGAMAAGQNPAYLYNNASYWGLFSSSGGALISYERSGPSVQVGGNLPVNITPGTAAGHAVALGQLSTPISATNDVNGTNTTLTAEVSFTAPGPGLLIAFGCRNNESQASVANISTLTINGNVCAQDDTLTTMSHMYALPTAGGAVTAQYVAASQVEFTAWVTLIWIPTV